MNACRIICNLKLGTTYAQNNISRSVSLTEKELKEAQSISDNYDSPLSPTQSSCSKGALLFHRRRQKLNALEQRQHELIEQRGNKVNQKTQHHQGKQGNQVQHEVRILNSVSTESQRRSGQLPVGKKMEETSSDTGYAEDTENQWGDDFKEPDFPPIDNRAPSPSASEEDHQISMCANLKENLTVLDTNGLVNNIVEEIKSPVKSEQNGQNKQYSEVHLTLSKPVNVANRTARPFGCKQSSKEDEPLLDKTPLIDLPPPPTYAETLSSPPPVTRVRSPPAYSALYPTQMENLHPVNQVVTYEEGRVTPQSKSGILESLAARRGPRKSMFTFIEKPKMAPNPDLMSMIQTADERRSKPNKHVETHAEDEPFALGAEASSFQNNKENRAADDLGPAEKGPDWSACLKSPEVRAKPPPVPIQGLTEATGKGADLFARRQSRMERFVVESPSPFDSARSPSPAMSLPPSWKYASNAHTPPAYKYSAKVNQRSPKPAMPVAVTNTASESVQSQKELEISKRQPYQLQSSLFILSPTKDPVSALPRAAPPPKPMVETFRPARQISCPTSPLVPSPTMYSPTYFNSIRSPSAVSPSPASDAPNNFGRQTPTNQVSPISPVPFSSTGVTSPRTKAVLQAPRPTFSARSVGLESQRSKEYGTGSPIPRALQHRGSLDAWRSSPLSFLPGYEEGTRSPIHPPRSMSPSWSERSPSPFIGERESGKQMKALIARNIINAAKRKNASSVGALSPQSPVPNNGMWSPKFGNGTSLPETPRSRHSPTGSEISLDSEDSGTKSPGFRVYPLSPRGWYGSLKQKRDSLPNNSPFTYTP
ncbi:synaptopodin isoform X2 [Xenopus laevis]|uniref:Synaptopodin isoform X2 n=1 Tax=Xenopus laevis TaxID=8355 RepID=A0A8J1MJQ8_XENLA|nr:synaptopodin isoform X2 [Xenopus laevis]